MGLAVASVASVVLRYRRGPGETRQQIRWIALAGVVLVASLWFASATNLWFLLGAEVLFVAAFVIAIMRYKVYAIDLVISKVVTYGLFALLIVLLYATLILTFISIFGDAQQRASGSLGLSLPMGATLIVAVAFEPLRQRLRRFANRVTYGKRAAPHEVLSQLASELADASQGGDLGGLARLLRDGTAAEYAAVWVGVGGRLVALAASPADSISAKAEVADWTKLPQSELELVVPIHQADDVSGALQIRKSRSRPVTPADRELLADVAAGAGLLIRNMTLNTELSRRASELRASRRRLIAAQDAARHRLERDLHDGAQQQVVALKVKLGLAEAVARREGAESIAERVAALAGQTQNAVDSMRAVARGLYPPLLEAEGLGTALRAVDRAAEIDVELRAADLPRYPREIEETVYFCVVSALSHGREAGATSAQVSIEVPDDGLFIEVSFDRDVDWVDSSILDRIEAFGGDIDAIERRRRNVLQLHLPVRVEADR